MNKCIDDELINGTYRYNSRTISQRRGHNLLFTAVSGESKVLLVTAPLIDLPPIEHLLVAHLLLEAAASIQGMASQQITNNNRESRNADVPVNLVLSASEQWFQFVLCRFKWERQAIS